MKCKSCFAPVLANDAKCQNCGISNPAQRKKFDLKWMMITVIIGFIILIVIPMAASFTWIR